MDDRDAKIYTREDMLFFAGMICELVGKDEPELIMKTLYEFGTFQKIHEQGRDMFRKLNGIKTMPSPEEKLALVKMQMEQQQREFERHIEALKRQEEMYKFKKYQEEMIHKDEYLKHWKKAW